MEADHLLRPWRDCLLDQLPDVRIFDAHTHLGGNDPSGFSASLDELLEALEQVDGRAAVFSMAEPEGYRKPNLACADAATAHPDRLVAFARITPQDDPTGLLQEALDAGARGVKLHLSSDEFALADPRLDDALRIAHERHLPVMVHAGPEVGSLTDDVLRLCERWSGLRMILAHCAIPDLAVLAPHVPRTPNLFFDTAWWTPANVIALMRLVPPGRVLGASDLPYCTTASSVLTTIRCAWQSGLDPDQVTSVIGGQMARLVDGEAPLEPGGVPADEPSPPSALLEIVSSNLLTSLEAMQRGDDPGVPLTVARHACRVPDGHPDAAVLDSVVRLLDLYEEHHESLPKRTQFTPGWDLVSAAAFVARTPAAPLP